MNYLSIISDGRIVRLPYRDGAKLVVEHDHAVGPGCSVSSAYHIHVGRGHGIRFWAADLHETLREMNRLLRNRKRMRQIGSEKRNPSDV